MMIISEISGVLHVVGYFKMDLIPLLITTFTINKYHYLYKH